MSPSYNATLFQYCMNITTACINCDVGVSCICDIPGVCIPVIEKDKSDIYQTLIVGFAGFTVLVYDHIITFSDEIKYVWEKKKGTIGWLFLFNRYVIPLGFIVNLFAYQWPQWSDERFVRYEGVMTVLGINVASLIMLYRIRILYKGYRCNWVTGFVGTLLAVEFVVNVFLLFKASSVPHLPPDSSCSMIFNIRNKPLSSGSAWLPLLFDTVVFMLTFNRTRIEADTEPFRSPLLEALWAEGLMYYTVICAINLTLTIMIGAADKGIQNIVAQLELLFTVAMISRITIDLKKQRDDGSSETLPILSKFECRKSSLECDLGEDVESREGIVCNRGMREPPAIHAVPSTNAGDPVLLERSLTTPCPETCYQSQTRNSDKFKDELVKMAGLRC